MLCLRSLRRRLALLPIIMWLRPAEPRRTRPLPVNRRRFLALLFVFIFGMTLVLLLPTIRGITSRLRSDPRITVENGVTLGLRGRFAGDRKSTRLNSSHSQISYAVFCLKKKTRY